MAHRKEVRRKVATVHYILASQRSGTVGLGLGLEKLFEVNWGGEIFHFDKTDADIQLVDDVEQSNRERLIAHLNFFNFRKCLFEKDPSLSFPSEENQEKIFEEYIAYAQKISSSKEIIFDVKYSSWHHLNPYWMMPGQRPLLAKFVKQKKCSIVHVIRENLFAQYCSLMLAVHTGKWHLSRGEKVTRKRINIDPKDCETRMNLVKFSQEWYESIFSNYENYSALYYERMFDRDTLSSEVVDRFSEIFGQKPKEQVGVPIRKTTPSLSQVVANREDVMNHFADGPFEKMVAQSLGFAAPGKA